MGRKYSAPVSQQQMLHRHKLIYRDAAAALPRTITQWRTWDSWLIKLWGIQYCRHHTADHGPKCK